MAQVQEPLATLTGKKYVGGDGKLSPLFFILDKDHYLWHTKYPIIIRKNIYDLRRTPCSHSL
jgi:hypothetical protein